MSVKLPKGDVRAAINLVDHPEILGRKIYLKGDLIAAYYGIPGIENITLVRRDLYASRTEKGIPSLRRVVFRSCKPTAPLALYFADFPFCFIAR